MLRLELSEKQRERLGIEVTGPSTRSEDVLATIIEKGEELDEHVAEIPDNRAAPLPSGEPAPPPHGERINDATMEDAEPNNVSITNPEIL